MKKGLLFMSLVLGLGVVNAQNTNVLLSKDGSAHSEHKQVVNPNHKATTFTVVNNTKDPIPAGHARVSLTAGDVWGDGSGYQLLLDADATAFGVEIPETGGSLTPSGNVPASVYAVFEYKIPINADGSLTTTNIVIDNTIAIDIPAGTYDWVITNPTAGDRMWISSGGRGDDKAFVAGTEYKFNVALNGQNDLVTLETLIGLNDIVTPTFGVYPNPAIDFVTISDANGSEIRIVDMLGRTLVSKVSTSNTETVSLNNLQSGMYMIQIIKDGKASTQKLIKR